MPNRNENVDNREDSDANLAMSDRRPAPMVLKKAYETFLTTDLSLDDIALDLGINRLALARVAREGKWRERKREVEVELFKSAEDKYRRFLIEERLPTVERHLRIAKAVEESIEKTLVALENGEISVKSIPATLKQLAEALSSASNVSARAAAISDTPFTDAAEKSAGKQPLVVINAAPQLPVRDEVKLVEGRAEGPKKPFNTEDLS